MYEPSEEFRFFVSHPELNKKYAGKHIAIVGSEVFDGKTATEAVNKAKKRYPDRSPAMAFVPKGDLLVL